ncbi:hypothetical protein HNP38_001153 [Chryseobacterium defluvii]|uniref:Uncharacterized protein n=1 Tax=Chryseobacterium defluvii TaxID=160396 RepID=A0A840K8S5_9FLAO|nr:hypothetical protein [Chryseobacterium defluvii]MBB4805881.1 hypothetical protein [Chryseobacterium defluvii]
MEVTFSNAIKYTQDPFDFIANRENKYVHGSKYMYSDEDYLQIIEKSIPQYLNGSDFKDASLSKEEIIVFNKVLEEQIEYWLSSRVHIPIKKVHILWFTKEKLLSLILAQQIVMIKPYGIY